jgi:hypothetical protein
VLEIQSEVSSPSTQLDNAIGATNGTAFQLLFSSLFILSKSSS